MFAVSLAVPNARTAFARAQRQSAGLAEDRVWQLVRGGRIDGYKFKRQRPIGRFVADFACDRLRLIVEIDGGVHERDDVVLNDHLRQTELEALGWTVLRFLNEEVLDWPDRVIDAIRNHAAAITS
jgi:very-short-patch-repair endonuclease